MLVELPKLASGLAVEMDQRVPDIAEQLLLIERELRLCGLWSTALPSVEALASQVPFCVDTLSFAQWLQWVFLPKMKFILEEDLPLPTASGILSMAQTVYADRATSLTGLLEVLQRFDQLIQDEDH